MKPYYEHAGMTIYHGDCREILPEIGKFDLVLTDPPYGIQRDRGMGDGGYGLGGKKRTPRRYSGTWDRWAPSKQTLAIAAKAGEIAIIWGGNYFASDLWPSTKWLVWDKKQTMPSYSDAEIAWTSLSGTSTKMFRYNGSGLMAQEKARFHPTQKPVALMKWCLSFAPKARLVLDPFVGSGTTLVAAKQEGRKAIGIEIEEKYCEIAARRLGQEVLQFE